MGRHKPAEIVALGTRSIAAIAEFLGTKPFLMGNEPTGIDATIFAFVAGTLCPHFKTPLRTAAERHANLSRYVGRMTARYYPDRSEIAGCNAAAWKLQDHPNRFLVRQGRSESYPGAG
jgi:glutathione S-transferase